MKIAIEVSAVTETAITLEGLPVTLDGDVIIAVVCLDEGW